MSFGVTSVDCPLHRSSLNTNGSFSTSRQLAQPQRHHPISHWRQRPTSGSIRNALREEQEETTEDTNRTLMTVRELHLREKKLEASAASATIRFPWPGIDASVGFPKVDNIRFHVDVCEAPSIDIPLE